MCGIIAVLRRPATRPAPDPAALVSALDFADAAFDHLDEVAARLEQVNRDLGGVPGVQALLDAGARQRLVEATARIGEQVARIEQDLDEGRRPASEAVNAAIVGIKDWLWAIGRDRVRAAEEVAALAGPGPS
ncbi:MAG TPA: hypothetical protein VGO92_13790, partial [Acidimicrobiales bacterium]|nr:hypothetical protein [Acidimicrobiales bacterium]